MNEELDIKIAVGSVKNIMFNMRTDISEGVYKDMYTSVFVPSDISTSTIDDAFIKNVFSTYLEEETFSSIPGIHNYDISYVDADGAKQKGYDISKIFTKDVLHLIRVIILEKVRYD